MFVQRFIVSIVTFNNTIESGASTTIITFNVPVHYCDLVINTDITLLIIIQIFKSIQVKRSQ